MHSPHRSAAALLAVVAVLSPLLLPGGVSALPASSYFGWTDNGCTGAAIDDGAYNAVDTFATAQWWTVTFVDDNSPVGGMLNFVRLASGLTSIVQVGLTDGSQYSWAPTSLHLWHDNTGGGHTSFCMGDKDDGGCFEELHPGALRVTGNTGDGSGNSYDLTVERTANDTWCMLNDHHVDMQPITWLHYAPRARVTGTISVNGQSHSISGWGQQDHVFGHFVPGVTLFKHWLDAHFTSNSLNVYWGSMYGEGFTFALVEHDVLPRGRMLFTDEQVTHSRTYGSNQQPTNYVVEGDDGTGNTFSFSYTPLLLHSFSGASDPVEDIATLSGKVCGSGSCSTVTGRGWAQVLGGPDPTDQADVDADADVEGITPQLRGFASDRPMAPAEREATCDVVALGATGDGKADDTTVLRAAVARCAEVVLPARHTFLSGPLNLTDDQVLRIDGTLLAKPASDIDAYPVIAPLPSYGWSRDVNCFDADKVINGTVVGVSRYSPIVGAFGKRNVSLVGSGTIDGQGQGWWAACDAHTLAQGRPRLVEINNCTHAEVRGLTLRDSPFWTLHPIYSRYVTVSGVSIYAPATRGNTDGVDPDSSSDVLIEDCYIQNGDDGVTLKSGKDHYGLAVGMPTQNVFVRNVTTPSNSRGGVAIGSEMSGGIRNITVVDSVFVGERGIHIKSCPGRGGFIEDITFRNVTTGSSGISLTMQYKGSIPGGPVPIVANVLFDGVSGSGGCSLDCQHAAGGECFNTTFTDVHLAHCTPPPPSRPSYYACDAAAACEPALPGAAGAYATLAECQAKCA